MEKIPTMFVRDEGKPQFVTRVVTPGCEWVIDGEGVATLKLDGTNVKIDDAGQLWKRQKPPKGTPYDDASYVECRREEPADRWMWEGFDRINVARAGIYELIGPKVQGNPQREPHHRLIRVVPMNDHLTRHVGDRSFEGIRAALVNLDGEGFVFHHPDGRMAKIKRRDFGWPWPITSPVAKREDLQS